MMAELNEKFRKSMSEK